MCDCCCSGSAAVAREYGADESNIPDTYEELTAAFRNCLGYASAARPLIVLVDALDQLSGLNPALSFPWVPGVLPPYSRLIVSALPALRPALARVVEPGNLVDLLPMSPGEGASLPIDLWLAETRHNLQPIQRQTVLESFAKYPYPLYLRLVFEHVRHWESYGTISSSAQIRRRSSPISCSSFRMGATTDLFLSPTASRAWLQPGTVLRRMSLWTS